MRPRPLQTKGGVLLVEVLIALSLFLAVATIVAQALSVAFVSEKASRSRALATSVLEELLTEVRASSEEHWDNIAALSRGSPYSMNMSGGHFVAVAGTSSVIIDGIPYARSFALFDAQRAINTLATPLAVVATSSMRIDNGSLNVIGTVTWGAGDTLTLSTILTRWRNVVCGQTSWSTTGSSTVNCDTTNVSMGGRTNIQTGNKLMLCSGC